MRSETCACGAAYTVDISDHMGMEQRELDTWRERHAKVCREHKVQIAPGDTLHIQVKSPPGLDEAFKLAFNGVVTQREQGTVNDVKAGTASD